MIFSSYRPSGPVPWMVCIFGAVFALLGGLGLNMFEFSNPTFGALLLIMFIGGSAFMGLAALVTLRHPKCSGDDVFAITLPLLPLIVVLIAFTYLLRTPLGIVFFSTELLAVLLALIAGAATAAIWLALAKTSVLNSAPRRVRMVKACCAVSLLAWPVARYPLLAKEVTGHNGVLRLPRAQTYAFGRLVEGMPRFLLQNAIDTGLNSESPELRRDIVTQCARWPQLARYIDTTRLKEIGYTDPNHNVRVEALTALLKSAPLDRQVPLLMRAGAVSQQLMDDLIGRFAFDVTVTCSGTDFQRLMRETNKQAELIRGAERAQRVDLLLYLIDGAKKGERHSLFELALLMNRSIGSEQDCYAYDRMALMILSDNDPLIRRQTFEHWTTTPWKNHGLPKFQELTPTQKTIYTVALCDKDLTVVRTAIGHLRENVCDPETLQLTTEAVNDDIQLEVATKRIRRSWPERDRLLRAFYSDEF